MRTILKIFLPVFLVALFFIFLELALRVFDYGYNTSYVVQRLTPKGPKAVLNPCALLSYLSLNTASAYITHEAFLNIPVDKPADNIRVVILGGSAAYGPYHFLGINLARYLEIMLVSRFPEHTIDVFNLTAPGLNSGAMTRLAKDALLLKPDFVVCYEAGNDLGRLLPMQKSPLHPQAVFLAEEIMYTLKRLKTYQLVVNHAGKYIRKIPERLLKNYNYDFNFSRSMTPAAVNACGAAYRHNIKKITALCRENHIPVFLCTYAYNSKNLCTADSFSGNTSLEEIEAGLPLLRQAYAFEKAGDYQTAIFYYERFYDLFPQFADPLCHMAFCYHALNMPEQAVLWYDKARSLSCGNWSLLENLNLILREIASQSSEDGIFLVDIVEALKKASPLEFMPGEEHFTDLAHFTSEGCYEAAAEIYRSLARHITNDVVAPPPSQEECHRRMGVTYSLQKERMIARCKETFAGLTAVLGAPPTSYALMHDVTKEYRLKSFTDKFSPSEHRDEAENIRDNPMPDNPDYYFYKNQVAGLLMGGEPLTALTVAERLVKATDRHSLALLLYGQILLSNNQPEPALEALQEAMGQPERAYDLGSRLTCAEVLMLLGRPGEALDMLDTGWLIIQNRGPVTNFEKRLFAGFRQRYWSVMESAREFLYAEARKDKQ